ncbi:thiamine-phosphate kinase [Faecalibacter rhinopitheci]|uniref:Thiamine-monophosphate kinase n=1 Tax=Faecalibacter rhinopitheci TaxID=2779678 RepID=A0A8J7G578_9FLAO|nr:thiamine-phosphate kinase [Faecalibacter rhinopitheci]MBF0596867.1 thiamine-phosphate kinase [Faecalibacter rhinopitheci]MBQ0148087.1 thiamine-phosphate kinase [Candidatus Onthonaster equi]
MLEDKSVSKTSLAEIGEFGLIEQIKEGFPIRLETSIKGIGDDAAVIDYGTEKTVISTDMLVEGVSFSWSYMPLRHLGYKAVVTAISDILAMNAIPKHILVSIAVSNRFTLEAIDEIYNGMKYACDKYEIDIVGGDTTTSLSGLILNMTAVGAAKEEKIVYRKGVEENDLLVVSGDLGAAFLGIQVLEREAQVTKVNPNNQPDFEPYSYLIERQLKPEARLDIIRLLAEMDLKPTSMIDISDGLSSEVIHLSKENNIGFNIYEEKIPLDPAVIRTAEEFKINPITCALSGGEDYELLFTIKQADFDKIKGNPYLTVIGHATTTGADNFLITRGSEQMIPLTAQGWGTAEEEKEN